MIFFKVTRLRNDTDRIRDGIVQIFYKIRQQIEFGIIKKRLSSCEIKSRRFCNCKCTKNEN